LTASNTLTLPIGTTTLAGLGTAQTFSATQTFSAAVTMSATTQNIALGTSQTTGTFTVGGAAQTGTQTFDQSTKAHTLNIGTGATENATTKTINFGTAGVSGSTTTINIGSAVSGATNSITINGNPTFSGGTADGVLYLNGSKVATSGSALTFDGTNIDLATVGAKVNFATTGSATRNYVGVSADGYSLEMVMQRGASQPLSYKQNFSVGHEWGIAGSGAMTLTSTGLGIGTSSPGAKLDVSSAGVVAARIYNTASSSDAYLICKNSSGESFFGVNATGPYIYTATAQAMTFLTNNAERARITSSGNFGIGTTNPLHLLHSVSGGHDTVGFLFGNGVYSTYQRGLGNNSIALITGRTTSDNDGQSGILAIGNNNTSVTPSSAQPYYGSLEFLGTETGKSNGNASSKAIISAKVVGAGGSTSGYGADLVFFTKPDNGTPAFENERMRITSGGEVYIAGTTDQGAYNLQVNGTGVWGAGAYVNGSDERLKDNIQTLNDGLAVVSQLRPVTFQYKPEHSKDQSVQPGFIAQELQQAMAGKDYVDGVVITGPEYLNVAYQNLIPILTKAIQEQQTIIQSLIARIAALESKGV
jgi:hypothetical protein